MKTPITYYGGKQKLVSLILPNIPQHTVYVEPFVGGGAIFFAKPPSYSEIINDLDSMIAIFYSVLKSDFHRLKKKIDTTLYDRTTHKFALCVRDKPHWFTDLQIAWSFFVLSGLGFSGTLDSFGCYTQGKRAQTFENKKSYFSFDLAKRLEGVQVECTDALSLIQLRDSDQTFFYCDPPYIDTIQSHYRGYTREMYIQLLETLATLKGHFLLSSFPSDVLNEYIDKNGWYSMEIEQSKPASKNADGSKKRKIEVLTANYPLKTLKEIQSIN
jgi:DNA adenine methylase